MSVINTVYIKIIGYDLNLITFKSLIQDINLKFGFNFIETPIEYAYGYEEPELKMRVNYFGSKQKLEVEAFYNTIEDLAYTQKVAKEILIHPSLSFKAIGLSFGRIIEDFPCIDYKFSLPVFENGLKYKINTEIKNIDETIYMTINHHFYNFDKVCNSSLDCISIINTEILQKLDIFGLAVEKAVRLNYNG